MALSSANSKAVHLTNAAVTAYHFPFKIFDSTQLSVSLVNPNDAVETKLELSRDYQVAGVAEEDGGSVTLTSAGRALAASGKHLVILRNMPFLQEIEFRPHEILYAHVLQKRFDMDAMERQQLKEMMGRAMIAPADQTKPIEYADLLSLRNDAVAAAQEAGEEATLAAQNAVAETAELLASYSASSQESSRIASQAALTAESAKENALNSAELAQNWAEQAEGLDTTARAWAIGSLQECPEGSAQYWAVQASQSVPDASTVVKGKVALATLEAAEAGLDTTSVITPATLAGVLDIIRAALLPRGVITLWSGATTNIPSGWALCNGANGTPDLRNRFVIGAGSTYAVGAKAGATTHTHTVSGSTNNHTLTTAQMPSHNHSMDAQIPSSPDQHGTGNYIVNTVQTAPTTLYTNNAGSNHGHAHTISSATAGSASNLPPYYALCYIMKL